MLAGELRDVRERRKVLLTPAADGGGLAALLRAVAADTGLRCWLLTGTGRVIAGSGELTRASAIRLAARYHRGDTVAYDDTVAYGDTGVDGEAGRLTLVPVGGDRRSVTEWFLACAGRERDWAAPATQALADLEADAAMERARLSARMAGERGLAEAVIGRLAAGAGDGAHTEALLRAAGLHPGYLAVSFATGSFAAAAGGAAGGGAAGGELDRELAEELLGHYAGRVAVAVAGDEILAVLSAGAVPAGTGPTGSGPAGSGPDGAALGTWLRETAPVLRAAGIRLTVGLSAPVSGSAGLAGALREASAARRAASVSRAASGPRSDAADLTDLSEPVVVAASAEVDSHELLLASVPATVLRSFRDRLLGPLLDYDAQHNAELMPTLRSFLECDGSWSACASRMYVHVNTVRYRIGRIEALTGRDLSALPDRVDFFLALRGSS